MKDGIGRPPPDTLVKVLAFMASTDFPQRLTTLRKAKGLTQQHLAERAGISVIQIHRYEAGGSQPSLEAIRRLSETLGVSADELVFGKHERGPDEDLRLQFEALSHFDAEEKKVAKAVLDSLILQHEAKKWTAGA